jgi:hypothetical protein
MDAYPEARFAIFNRDDQNVASESELVIATGAQAFNVCEISLVEMSEFFQRTYELSDQEASVVALRLRDMFRKFELNVHPSYFAGVAGELLNALLRANRRAELLQIAVGGFLSFAVSADLNDVKLSRSTRERYLRLFAFERRVGKRTFDLAGLVKFTQDFAAESDFEIDAIDFIKSFQDRGLLHFNNETADISLPFVEAYLLASELKNRPGEAKRYFEFGAGDLDTLTFDLYSELGPDPAIVENLIAALERVVGELGSNAADKHILLTDQIQPDIVLKQSRLHDLDERLQRAISDVRESRPNSLEKQRILDIANQIEERARTAQEVARRDDGSDDSDALARLVAPFRLWGLAIVLLGSGSESLSKDPKRRLAAQIVHSTSILLDELLRLFPKVQFADLKQQFQDDAFLRTTFDIPADKPVRAEVREFVGTIVDAYEFSLLGYPLRIMLSELGNAAGQPVLRPSVASVKTDGLMENLIARVWGSEINAAKNNDELLAAIADLPPAAFLRISLSAHFMTRVFWNHWERANRLALLDAAIESIRPLNAALDKGRIIRLVDAQVGDETEK